MEAILQYIQVLLFFFYVLRKYNFEIVVAIQLEYSIDRQLDRIGDFSPIHSLILAVEFYS